MPSLRRYKNFEELKSSANVYKTSIAQTQKAQQTILSFFKELGKQKKGKSQSSDTANAK
jgi:hypothetical protein